MRLVPEAINTAWTHGNFVGDQRPIVRLTIARLRSDTHHVAENTFYSSAIFSTSVRQREIPQEAIQSFEWSRSVDSDIASCSVRLSNNRIEEFAATDPEGQSRTYQRFQPGIFTYNYGTARFSNRWGREPEPVWNRFFMPDNIIRSYEGYGWDPNVCADKDPHLVRTGVWKIDTISISHDGTMQIECRDLGAMLADHIVFPPVNPWKAGFKNKDMPDGAYAYPVSFRGSNPEPVVEDVPLDPQRIKATFDDSSNSSYYARNAPIYGHRPTDAFDSSTSSYWLSVGNARRDAGYSFEWIQAKVPKTTVRQVQFRTRGTGYMAYLCVYADGKWQGKRTTAYDPNHPVSAPNGSNTRYVAAVPVTSEGTHTLTVPGGIKNATKVRLTFGNLWNSGLGPYVHRAAVRNFHVFGGPLSKQVVTKINNKNINDWTDAVKLFCAWGGLYWPRVAYQRSCDDSLINMSPARDDKTITIRAGRVWGDFENTGIAPVAEVPASQFDKQSLLEGISYIRDIVGYLFYIDENGAAVFRHPNIFQLGNLMRVSSGSVGQRTMQMYQLDEEKHVLSVASTLSSRNMYERVFVSSTDGVHGAMSAGWNPNPSSMRRIAGWSDMHFESNEECQVMADLITLRQLFAYRRDRVVIPAHPGIQVDDQVRIWERTTNDGFVHYVRGITSNNDQQSGEWTYELDTHWLGDDPFQRWAFDQKQLSKEAQTYVSKLFIKQI